MEKIKFVTLNARGLNNALKRRKIFRQMKDKKADICMIQETHGSENKSKLWASEWGNKCYFANGESNARGVGLLLSKTTAKGVKDVILDPGGRYLICKIEYKEQELCIVNLYGPNIDEPNFFEQIRNKVNEMGCMYVIVGGDFNVALEPAKDRGNGKIINGRARYCIINIIENGNSAEELETHLFTLQ